MFEAKKCTFNLSKQILFNAQVTRGNVVRQHETKHNYYKSMASL